MLPDTLKTIDYAPDACSPTDSSRPVGRLRAVHAATHAAGPNSAAKLPHTVLSPLPPGDRGLQLLTDNPAWLSRVRPALRHLPVTYHVLLARHPDPPLVARLRRGVTDFGEFLAAADARVLEAAPTPGWLQVTMNHGKATSVRRLLSAFGLRPHEVVRIQVGPVALGSLALNESRDLEPEEVAALAGSLQA